MTSLIKKPFSVTSGTIDHSYSRDVKLLSDKCVAYRFQTSGNHENLEAHNKT